jgi:hypothetical protein
MVDKKLFKDKMGRYITQGLFIDFRYDETFAVYTLEDEDKTYKGNLYPSLKRLYLEEEDPTEYNFANKYLFGWEHWNVLKNNKELYKHIEKWEEELEVKMRAKGVHSMLKMAEGSNFNAAKWVADGQWTTKRGRPSKAEKEQERKIRERAMAEAEDEASRILPFVRKENA